MPVRNTSRARYYRPRRQSHLSLGADACVAFLEGLSGNALIDEYILRPCMEHNASKILNKSERARYLLKNVISINQAAMECAVDEISAEITSPSAKIETMSFMLIFSLSVIWSILA